MHGVHGGTSVSAVAPTSHAPTRHTRTSGAPTGRNRVAGYMGRRPDSFRATAPRARLTRGCDCLSTGFRTRTSLATTSTPSAPTKAQRGHDRRHRSSCMAHEQPRISIIGQIPSRSRAGQPIAEVVRTTPGQGPRAASRGHPEHICGSLGPPAAAYQCYVLCVRWLGLARGRGARGGHAGRRGEVTGRFGGGHAHLGGPVGGRWAGRGGDPRQGAASAVVPDVGRVCGGRAVVRECLAGAREGARGAREAVLGGGGGDPGAGRGRLRRGVCGVPRRSGSGASGDMSGERVGSAGGAGSRHWPCGHRRYRCRGVSRVFGPGPSWPENRLNGSCARILRALTHTGAY